MIHSTGMACAGLFCLEGNLHEASADYLLLDNLSVYGTAQMQRPTRYSRVLACFTLASLHALALALRASLHSLAWPLHASLHALASALLASLHSTLPAGSLHENKLSSS